MFEKKGWFFVGNMCKRARRTPGTAEREASVAHLLASEARGAFRVTARHPPSGARQTTLLTLIPGRSIERVYGTLATPSN